MDDDKIIKLKKQLSDIEGELCRRFHVASGHFLSGRDHMLIARKLFIENEIRDLNLQR